MNSTLWSWETVAPSDLDAIVGTVRSHMAGLLCHDLPDEQGAQHKVHDDFLDAEIKGRLWSLSKAYVQLA